ncbi:hypothetical protein DEU56DRAFT_769676 [Suillus clintonianus]|uniref:uncharacterized protein n=1 Tax=Suillus clintonianus TaxID=1904413 RepID=UPI001B87DD98|nr:uncharacterized protein DEU56DRAFT_769676 [Suillus clintonianus]KAG2154667.1 hypothetical protein DEU56DRAFT_769676 [Suillus clintonianus]
MSFVQSVLISLVLTADNFTVANCENLTQFQRTFSSSASSRVCIDFHKSAADNRGTAKISRMIMYIMVSRDLLRARRRGGFLAEVHGAYIIFM